jgi:hypothetical protein
VSSRGRRGKADITGKIHGSWLTASVWSMTAYGRSRRRIRRRRPGEARSGRCSRARRCKRRARPEPPTRRSAGRSPLCTTGAPAPAAGRAPGERARVAIEMKVLYLSCRQVTVQLMLFMTARSLGLRDCLSRLMVRRPARDGAPCCCYLRASSRRHCFGVCSRFAGYCHGTQPRRSVERPGTHYPTSADGCLIRMNRRR